MRRWLLDLLPFVGVALLFWRQQTLERDLSRFVDVAHKAIDDHMRESMNALVGTVSGEGQDRAS